MFACNASIVLVRWKKPGQLYECRTQSLRPRRHRAGSLVRTAAGTDEWHCTGPRAAPCSETADPSPGHRPGTTRSLGCEGRGVEKSRTGRTRSRTRFGKTDVFPRQFDSPAWKLGSGPQTPTAADYSPRHLCTSAHNKRRWDKSAVILPGAEDEEHARRRRAQTIRMTFKAQT